MRLRLPHFGLPLLAKDLAELAQRRQTYGQRVSFAILLFTMSALFFVPTYVAGGFSPLSVLGGGSRLLYSIYEMEFCGLCVFVPAIVGGALAAEKERNTLQLVFLTRLGPGTILLEKLLSRLVPVATLLLISVPVLLVAYLVGGVSRSDINFAVLGLFATAFQVACISLFCSAFCATAASAFVMSFLILAAIYVAPYFGVFIYVAMGLRTDHWNVTALGAAIDAPEIERAFKVIASSNGLSSHWVLNQWDGAGISVAPFHRDYVPLAVMTSIGFFFLLLARVVIVRRMAPQPQYLVHRLFRRIDSGFRWINNRLGAGIEFGGRDGGLPVDHPVAWRESRRGNLGRINYLIRVIMIVEVPIVIPTTLYAITTRASSFEALLLPALFFWSIAFLVVSVRSAGLIAAEKARQTLDVLVVTPLSLSVLLGEKWRGLWRVMAVVSVPILIYAVIDGYFQTGFGGPRRAYYELQGFDPTSALPYLLVVAANLAIVLSLAAQLAFLFGLLTRTQVRATVGVLGLLFTWCMLPLVIRVFTRTGPWILYLSPFAGVAVNQVPELGLPGNGPWQRDAVYGGRAFYLLVHCAIYTVIVLLLAGLNYRVAGRVLVRPWARGEGRGGRRGGVQKTAANVCR
jgi:ABC-type transport system involved in multi-copper enzyme maturation permease subunit